MDTMVEVERSRRKRMAERRQEASPWLRGGGPKLAEAGEKGGREATNPLEPLTA